MHSMTPQPLWHAAASFAARAHQHQVRKDGATPYFAHVARVALIVATRFGIDDEEILAAAYLHDTIEDCDTDYEDILDRFGEVVATYVAALTKDMRMPEAERELAYDAQLAAAPWQARLLKLADVMDNLADASGSVRLDKVIDKAHRALALTTDDRQLIDAREMVTALVRAAEAGVTSRA
jgi:(p)ppGpp synthase/HD superfamily hydrolase